MRERVSRTKGVKASADRGSVRTLVPAQMNGREGKRGEIRRRKQGPGEGGEGGGEGARTAGIYTQHIHPLSPRLLPARYVGSPMRSCTNCCRTVAGAAAAAAALSGCGGARQRGQ